MNVHALPLSEFLPDWLSQSCVARSLRALDPPALLAFAPHAVALCIVCALLLALRRWPPGYALLMWPGTLAHELLHYLAGALTGARPVSISLLPRRQQDGHWALGSVSFARLRWWNSVPVGLAPMALLPAGGWVWLESASWPLLSAGGTGLKLLAAQCLLAGWPSRRDWAHAMLGLLVIAALALTALWLMRGWA